MLLKEIATALNEVVPNYHLKVCALYFVAVVFAATRFYLFEKNFIIRIIQTVSYGRKYQHNLGQ